MTLDERGQAFRAAGDQALEAARWRALLAASPHIADQVIAREGKAAVLG